MCAGVGSATSPEAQRKRDLLWVCVAGLGLGGSSWHQAGHHLEPGQFWKDPAPPVLDSRGAGPGNKFIQNVSGAQRAPCAGGGDVQGGGHSGKPLGSFSELLCPMLGLFCPPWLRFLGSSLEPGAQGGRLPALGWGETPVLLPAKLYPEISSRQPGFSGVLSQNGV